MKVSCGIIVENFNNEILGCHPFGRKDGLLDIPKGGNEKNESYLETAIRELYEETGLILSGNLLEDCGLFDYNSEKKLYIFKTKINYKLSKLKCESFFELDGKMVPEMIGFESVPKNKIADKFFKKLNPIILKLVGE